MTRKTWLDYAPDWVLWADADRPGFAQHWRDATIAGAAAEVQAQLHNLGEAILQAFAPLLRWLRR